MSSSHRVALVTGANKGIGFAITRDLCRQFSGDVVLTAPDTALGQAAVQQLQAEGLSPRFHQLDIDDLQSIQALRDFLRREYGGLDVLVNNAGITFRGKGLGCSEGRWPPGEPPAGWEKPCCDPSRQEGLNMLPGAEGEQGAAQRARVLREREGLPAKGNLVIPWLGFLGIFPRFFQSFAEIKL